MHCSRRSVITRSSPQQPIEPVFFDIFSVCVLLALRSLGPLALGSSLEFVLQFSHFRFQTRHLVSLLRLHFRLLCRIPEQLLKECQGLFLTLRRARLLGLDQVFPQVDPPVIDCNSRILFCPRVPWKLPLIWTKQAKGIVSLVPMLLEYQRFLDALLHFLGSREFPANMVAHRNFVSKRGTRCDLNVRELSTIEEIRL